MQIMINKIIKTCGACPAQWDMWDFEGVYYYVRYRWGVLRIDSPHGKIVFRATIDESGWDGVMSFEELKLYSKTMFAYDLVDKEEVQ